MLQERAIWLSFVWNALSKSMLQAALQLEKCSQLVKIPSQVSLISEMCARNWKFLGIPGKKKHVLFSQTPHVRWKAREGNESLSRYRQTMSALYYQSPHLSWDFQVSLGLWKYTSKLVEGNARQRVKPAPWEALTSSLNNSAEHRPASYFHGRTLGLWCAQPPERHFCEDAGLKM